MYTKVIFANTGWGGMSISQLKEGHYFDFLSIHIKISLIGLAGLMQFFFTKANPIIIQIGSIFTTIILSSSLGL